MRSGDVHEPLELSRGDVVTFTIVEGADGSDAAHRLTVNYDGFLDDVGVGDTLLVDGGVMSMEVESVTDTEVACRVVDGGTMKSRRHLNVRGKSANLPAITERDWDDIKFGVEQGIDYIALSFVRDAAAIRDLKEWLKKEGCTGTSAIGVLAKIESADSVQVLDEILDAADGAMAARGGSGRGASRGERAVLAEQDRSRVQKTRETGHCGHEYAGKHDSKRDTDEGRSFRHCCGRTGRY